MLHSLALDEKKLMALIQPVVVFTIAMIAMLIARRILLQLIKRADKGPKSSGAVLLDALKFPSMLWAVAAALEIALQFVDLGQKAAARVDLWVGVFVIVSLTLVAMSAAVRMITQYGERTGMPFAMAGLSRTLIRLVVLATGAMMLLKELGKDITPALTALGVGGLAVALALQDTLANFFAGIHILVERPIFVGDIIKLEGGQEGVVTDIGWRTTRVRAGTNDIFVVPNTKITSGILLNYSLPEPRAVAEVTIMVGHDADPRQVSRIALEEAAKVDGVLAKPEPLFFCDPGVLTTHMQSKLVVNVVSHGEQGRVLSDVRMRLIDRFRAEGVPLPDVNISQPAR